ncbi:AAA family ATPase [Nostoc sp. UIC 10630]|uniref:AAA family ATPase n=1 Tax=Nostoc sp. UIC 10630 TaxID=2100146 RepID=UPI00158F3AE8|nr:AAA family ATPase [Nostoc sp. UIC 10630]
MNDINLWRIFRSDAEPHDGIKKLPPPPQWRSFGQNTGVQKQEEEALWGKFQEYIRRIEEKIDKNIINSNRQRGESFKMNENSADKDDPMSLVIDAVNAALYLRRPLLITGGAGSGKTSLAYAIAYQLQLGPVLYWPITTRTSLQDGLYRYDAIARLQDTQFRAAQRQADLQNQQFRQQSLPAEQREAIGDLDQESPQNIGRYIELGPLGTAFLQTSFPRVLLIDEVDKSDINLPNDLLYLFEEGLFKIPELVRMSRKDEEQVDNIQENASQIKEEVQVGTCEGISTIIKKGTVLCEAFPLILMTSNGERDFPPAFLRRCVRVRMPDPTEEGLKAMVKAKLGDVEKHESTVNKLVKDFINLREKSSALANDQLLNTVYLMTHAYQATDSTESADLSEGKKRLQDLLLKTLTSEQDNQ